MVRIIKIKERELEMWVVGELRCGKPTYGCFVNKGVMVLTKKRPRKKSISDVIQKVRVLIPVQSRSKIK